MSDEIEISIARAVYDVDWIAILACAALARLFAASPFQIDLVAKCAVAEIVLIGSAGVGRFLLLQPDKRIFVRGWLFPSRVLAIESCQ